MYDVATKKWIEHKLPLPADFKPEMVYTAPVFNQNDNLLYWVDERRGFMCALDWKKMKLYSGPVVGMEPSRVLSNLKTNYNAICLNHLWDDYFCLVWSATSATDFEIN